MKSGLLKLAGIVIGLNLLFVYIGLYFLPQSESRPPAATRIEESISPEELVQTGRKLFLAKASVWSVIP